MVLYVLLSYPLSLIMFLILLMICCLKYLMGFEDEKPRIYCTDSPLTRFILQHCRKVKRPFRPAFWAQNGHVQTLLAYVMPAVCVKFDREYVLMRDHGTVAIDWAELGKDTWKDYPLMLILPGMTGDAHTMSRMCKLAIRRGFRPVVFNKRGHGGSVITSPRLQSFGDPEDFRRVVKYIRALYPKCNLLAVGYGTGSALLLSYLGEYGSSCHLSAAVCVSPCYDAEYFFKECMRQPYDFIFLYDMKSILSAHVLALSKTTDILEAMKANTLVEFEQRLYCKMNGNKSSSEYWEKNNPRREIDEVAIPVLCISSVDDPLWHNECTPYSLFTDCPNFMLITTTRGGHCGFFEGPDLESWADKVTIDYLTAVVNFICNTKISEQFS